MEDSACHVEIVLLIAKWELMSGGMPKEARILYALPALVVEYVHQYVPGVYLNLRIKVKKGGLESLF